MAVIAALDRRDRRATIYVFRALEERPVVARGRCSTEKRAHG